MAKIRNDLEDFKKDQKKVDEMQTEELKKQSAKDREHDEELVRQRSVDEAHDDKIADLESKHENVKADVSQLKNDLENAIEAVQSAERPKDKEQDKKLGRLENDLISEALKIKNLYVNFEEEVAKIEDLYDKIYTLKQRNISQGYIDRVQDIDIKEVQENLKANTEYDEKQSSDITQNRDSIYDNFVKINKMEKSLRENKDSDIVTRSIAITSLIGVIVLFIIKIFF